MPGLHMAGVMAHVETDSVLSTCTSRSAAPSIASFRQGRTAPMLGRSGLAGGRALACAQTAPAFRRWLCTVAFIRNSTMTQASRLAPPGCVGCQRWATRSMLVTDRIAKEAPHQRHAIYCIVANFV